MHKVKIRYIRNKKEKTIARNFADVLVRSKLAVYVDQADAPQPLKKKARAAKTKKPAAEAGKKGGGRSKQPNSETVTES